MRRQFWCSILSIVAFRFFMSDPPRMCLLRLKSVCNFYDRKNREKSLISTSFEFPTDLLWIKLTSIVHRKVSFINKYVNLNYFALNTCHACYRFLGCGSRFEILSLKFACTESIIIRKYAQNFDLNTNVFSTHLWRTLASVFCPTFDIAAKKKDTFLNKFSSHFY